MTILVLGHKGMLGHMVCKFYESQNIEIVTTDHRWPSQDFKSYIISSQADYAINCIAAISQKGHKEFSELNVKLPVWLANNFTGKILHPTTDGEFSGKIQVGDLYRKDHVRDAEDDYGLSKASASAILQSYENVKQIRTSINGPDLLKKASLFSWFTNSGPQINSIENHYWSGITSLEWSKQSLKIIRQWEKYPKIIQLSSKCITKMRLLEIINDVFELNKTLTPVRDVQTINRCLISDEEVTDLRQQFIELKNFYYE